MTPEYLALVEELDAVYDGVGPGEPPLARTLVPRASEAISALVADNEELRRDVDTANQRGDSWRAMVREDVAKVEELRETLSGIEVLLASALHCADEQTTVGMHADVSLAMKRARAALSRSLDKKEG